MASNYTPHFNLCQWSAEDPILRADFNADNEKLDAALAEKANILIGSYVGDAAESREIVLGFRPKFVQVWHNECQESNSNIAYAGIATENGYTTVNDKPVVQLTDQGFMVYYGNYSNDYAGYYVYTNIAENAYSYMAIR